jgi:phosphate starvation-inducible PhoH-like protein
MKNVVILYSKRKSNQIDEYKYKTKNENQDKYVEYLNNEKTKIVIAVGPAGTGKTMFACLKAINELKSGNLNKVIITRPIIAVEEEELGFLPGNLVKKMDPWTRPIMDIFMEYYQKSEVENMIYNNQIEIAPLAYMRGRTFKNALIIADEMQNSTPNQMLMLTTRIGKNSKLVITGDLKQVDRSVNNNGLYDLIEKVKKYNEYHRSESIEVIEFKKEDIERSEIVEKVINIYQFVEPKVTFVEPKVTFVEPEKVLEPVKKVLEIKNEDAAMIPLKDVSMNMRRWD